MIGGKIGNWFVGWTLGEIGSFGLVEEGEFVVLFIGGAVDPVVPLKIVPIDIVDHFAALGSGGILHDLHVVPHLVNFSLDGLYDFALAIRTLGISIWSIECALEGIDGSLHILYLGSELILLLLGEVKALAGSEREGHVEVGLQIEQGIAFVSHALLQEDEFLAVGNVGVLETKVYILEFRLDCLHVVCQLFLGARQRG